MEETTLFQRVLWLLMVGMGLGVVVALIAYLVKKDRRSMGEKLVDRAKVLVDR